MPIILYGLPHSGPCIAVLVTGKVIGVQFDFRKIELMNGEHLTESYKKINPSHSIPCLDDDGLRIWESRAIITYLTQQYGKPDIEYLYPKDPKKRARVDNMLHFDGASLYASFTAYFYPHFMENKPYDSSVEGKVRDRLTILDTILSENKFVAGGDKPSLADISIRCALFTPAACGYNIEAYKNIAQWIARFEVAFPFFKEFTTDRLAALKNFFAGLEAANAAKA